MATTAKITLSAQEQQLVNDTGWILTKRGIIDKVYSLLGNVSVRMQELVEAEKDWLPPELIITSPKIYKGENYRMLPYVLLDHPRYFNGPDSFAIRTMFWWGNFFSITLHIKGRYKIMFEEQIRKKLAVLQQDNYFICVNEDEWQHHYADDNYIAAAETDEEKMTQITTQSSFIKLSLQFSLSKWDEMPVLLENAFYSILQLLKD